MSIRILAVSAVVFCAASSVSAQDSGKAHAVLQAALDGPDVAYTGTVSVQTQQGDTQTEKYIQLAYSPPAEFKREVVDRHGFPILTIVSNGEEEWVYDRRRAIAWKGEPADPDYKLVDPDEERRLLEKNYDLRIQGTERVAGRSCTVLEVRSKNGGKAARRLWVDRTYGLVLQRVAYHRDGREASRMRFIKVDIPAQEGDVDFDFTPPAGVKTAANKLKPDYLEFDEAATATDMQPYVPGWLPPGYMFESLNLLPYKGVTILHYRFTDGVDVLSLFQSPRRAQVRFPQDALGKGSPQRVQIGKQRGRLTLAAEGKFLEWGTQEHFVLLGRLGAEAMRRVAASLKPVAPEEAAP